MPKGLLWPPELIAVIKTAPEFAEFRRLISEEYLRQQTEKGGTNG